MWEHIIEHHNGYLPLRIKAVPEGTIVATRNVLMTIGNTDPKYAALTTFLEKIRGNPIEVLPRLLDILYKKIGGHVNEKSFKVLEKHDRLIQGDGVNMESIKDILNLLERIGFSADDLVFASGGGLLQKVIIEHSIVLIMEYSFETIRSRCDIDVDKLDFMHLM
ncbi:unnamed protein product [Rotaria magnacalcarata]|uniref:Nicotinate/nicotinamide phosphoribosyltransferase domain-containing protein n=2 Tax=Rotaria magnacalcarata TaxID=392030 RepID=A0A816XV89_9BILA|nr:unnamed protein product [Rotaria magnacalcarata]CAF2151047.1 unnamed protein product [Rotaria magnacalcarata]